MKRFAALLLALVLVFALCIPASAFVTQRSNQALSVNGVLANCDKYNIDGNNYFKLRDLAKLLNGTGSQFDVGWNAQANLVTITTNHSYTMPNGHELEVGADLSSTAQVSAQVIMINGVVRSDLTVYNIGGSNFFKLRELGDALGFNVGYDESTRTMLVTSRGADVQQHRELNAEEIFERCSPAVFYIEIYDASETPIKSGSGFFVNSNGVAVTNYHVISGASSALVQLTNGSVYDITGVYAWSEDEDWAVIQVGGSGFSTLTVGDQSTAVGGATIYAIGSPLGLQNTISTGIISNPSRPDGNVNYIQISAPISHGSSGGALINKYGEVIGITSAGYDDGQNLNLAIPMTYVKYQSLGTLTPLSTAANEYAASVSVSDDYVNLALNDSAYRVWMYSECPAGWIIRTVVDNGDIVEGRLGSWDGDYIPLDIEPKSVGSTYVTVYLLDENENVKDTKYINVTVTPSSSTVTDAGGKLYVDETNVTIGLSDTWWLTYLAEVNDPAVEYYSVIYYVSDASVLNCSWGEWYDGNYIDLDLTPRSTGTVTITVSLVDYNDQSKVLDTVTTTVTVVPGSVFN